jgi:hypothetical protein
MHLYEVKAGIMHTNRHEKYHWDHEMHLAGIIPIILAELQG